jgi:hypothetical protein
MTTRAASLLALLAALTSACTAPGEPPPHPNTATYQDLIRRELSTTTSTLATMQLTLNYANHDRITQTYATTITRQAQADLTRVATDLTQITPPPQYTTPHKNLQTLASHAAHQLATLLNHWTHTSRNHELQTLNTETQTANRLNQQLLG